MTNPPRFLPLPPTDPLELIPIKPFLRNVLPGFDLIFPEPISDPIPVPPELNPPGDPLWPDPGYPTPGAPGYPAPVNLCRGKRYNFRIRLTYPPPNQEGIGVANNVLIPSDWSGAELFVEYQGGIVSRITDGLPDDVPNIRANFDGRYSIPWSSAAIIEAKRSDGGTDCGIPIPPTCDPPVNPPKSNPEPPTNPVVPLPIPIPIFIKPEVNLNFDVKIPIDIRVDAPVNITIDNNFDFGNPTPTPPAPAPNPLPPARPKPAPSPTPKDDPVPEPPLDSCGQLKKCLDEDKRTKPVEFLRITVTQQPTSGDRPVFLAPGSTPPTWVYLAGYAGWTRNGAVIGELTRIASLDTLIPKPPGANGFKAFSLNGALIAVSIVVISPTD